MNKTKKAIVMVTLIALSGVSSYSYAATTATGTTTTTNSVNTAFEFATWATVSEITGNSAKISWDALEWANWYMVHYWTKSAVKDGKYELDSDLLDSTGTTLEKLSPKTTYYVSVTAYDKDANESPLSTEVSFTTSDSTEATTTSMNRATSTFWIKSVNVMDANKLEVSFSADLDNKDWAKREFKLASKEGLEIAISSVELTDATKLVLNLSTPLETWKEYLLTAVSIQDKDGNTIEAWVDGQTSFTTPETFAALDSASWAVSESGALNAASNVKELPKTGPEQFLILALALILGFIVVRFRNRIV